MYCDTSTVNCTLRSHASLSSFDEVRHGDLTLHDPALAALWEPVAVFSGLKFSLLVSGVRTSFVYTSAANWHPNHCFVLQFTAISLQKRSLCKTKVKLSNAPMPCFFFHFSVHIWKQEMEEQHCKLYQKTSVNCNLWILRPLHRRLHGSVHKQKWCYIYALYTDGSFSHADCSFVDSPGVAHRGKVPSPTASRPHRLFRQLHASALTFLRG